MAKLYFRYGAMGSSKTANAIMVRYNYMERGQKALMLKPALERRDGEAMVRSRSGLCAPCEYVENLANIDVTKYDCLIVDDAQFMSKEQVVQLCEIVDKKNVPVICYGLRADFMGNLFPGSQWLLAWADAIEEVKTVCWCGKKATCNARISNGVVVRAGEQVMLGGNESYVSLCRKHHNEGNLGPGEIRRIDKDKKRFLYLLIDADPDEEMIDKYLETCDMYVMYENGEPIAEAVIEVQDDGCEIRNIATDPAHRGKGHASALIKHLAGVYKHTGRMRVCTSDYGVGFYSRVGFTPERVIKNYFIDNYPDPIFENGVQIRDMTMLSMAL